jgi:signal transduction histidine kinase
MMPDRTNTSRISPLKKLFLSVPLRVKILGLALGLILTLSLVTISLVRQELNRSIDRALREESSLIAGELSHQARDLLLINDIFALNSLLKNMQLNRPDIRYIFVHDSGNQVLAHTFDRLFPFDLLRSGLFPAGRAESITTHLATNEGMIWDTHVEVFPGGNIYIRVGVKGDNLRRQLSSLTGALVNTTIIVAAIGVALSLFLSWLIAKPVTQLLAATREIRRGNYDFSLPRKADDEIGKLIDGFSAMAHSLAQAEKVRQEKEKLQKEFLQRLMAGQEGERKHIARELHDQTGQALASCMVELKLLEQTSGSEALQQGIARLKKSITSELESLHTLALDLRPSVLDDLGLIPAVEMYFNRFREQHRLPVQLRLLGPIKERIDACVETCIYRIIQESLTNMAKYAEATEAALFLERKQETIRGGIEDNGIGFDPETIDPTKSMGLYGMQERIQLLGGKFTINSDRGIGTMISFELPVKPEVCHEKN